MAGQFFSVRFRKRSDGTIRDMRCRMGVAKHIKGGERAYDFKEKNLLPVYDMEKQAYRSIPIEAIILINNEPPTKEVIDALIAEAESFA